MRKCIGKKVIEDITYEISQNKYDDLVAEMQRKGYVQHDIQGEFMRDNETVYVVSFKKDILQSTMVIETNLSLDSTDYIQDHQSRVILIDSWKSYTQEIMEGKSIPRHAAFGGMHGHTLPENAMTFNVIYDDYHLKCDMRSGYFANHSKKLAYKVR